MPTVPEEIAELSCGMTEQLFEQKLQQASDEALLLLSGKQNYLIKIHLHATIQQEVARRKMVAEQQAAKFAVEGLGEAKRANEFAQRSLTEAEAATTIALRAENLAHRAFDQDRRLGKWGIAIGLVALVVSIIALCK